MYQWVDELPANTLKRCKQSTRRKANAHKDEIIWKFCVKKYHIASIAKQLGLSHVVISNYLKVWRVNIKGVQYKHKYLTPVELVVAKELYLKCGLSKAEIADWLGVKFTQVDNSFSKHGVKLAATYTRKKHAFNFKALEQEVNALEDPKKRAEQMFNDYVNKHLEVCNGNY